MYSAELQHLYVIPTTRSCVTTIESLKHEFLRSQSEYGPAGFLLLDQCRGETARRHVEHLRALARQHPDASVYYVRAHEVDELVLRITRHNERFAGLQPERCFSDDYSYGMAANRLSLVAASLGAKFLHRRDSDVSLQIVNGRALSPYEIEVKFIGKSILELKRIVACAHSREPFVDVDPTEFDDHLPIYMVGGAYKGDWPIDYGDLQDTHLDLLHDLIHQGRPTECRSYVEDMVRQKLICGSVETYSGDELKMPIRDLIEVGNYSLFRLFSCVPVSPSVRTSGVDYIYHALLESLKLPQLYHNRRVLHGYTDERLKGSWSIDYYLGLALFRSSACYYRHLYADISAEPSRYYANGEFNSEHIADVLDEIGAYSKHDEQRWTLNSMSDVLERSNMEKYRAVARAIRARQEELSSQTAADVRNHAILTRYWRALVAEFRQEEPFRSSRLT